MEHDQIDLHVIDANDTKRGNQAFTFIGDSGFSHHAGELRAVHTEEHVRVYGDVNGDGKADFAILVDGVSQLVASNFIL